MINSYKLQYYIILYCFLCLNLFLESLFLIWIESLTSSLNFKILGGDLKRSRHAYLYFVRNDTKFCWIKKSYKSILTFSQNL